MNQTPVRPVRPSLLERAASRYAPPPRIEVPPVADAPLDEPHVPAPAQPPRKAAMPPARIRPADVAAIDRELLAEGGMLVPGGPVTALAEEFRLVKRQLLAVADRVRRRDADAARLILVCSAQPGDGKTFCAINLALSLAAERDLSVLLVDADFAKPDILDRLGVKGTRGLLDALGDPAMDPETLVIQTDVPQLALLAADPQRIILFDSSPALAASPASVLAGLVGQTVLVVRADKSSDSDLREAVSLLDGCEEIQLLLNATTFRSAGARFGYYGLERA